MLVGSLAAAAVELNLSFLIPQLLDRPAVTLKWAMSLDGRIATVAGERSELTSNDTFCWASSVPPE